MPVFEPNPPRTQDYDKTTNERESEPLCPPVQKIAEGKRDSQLSVEQWKQEPWQVESTPIGGEAWRDGETDDGGMASDDSLPD